jgi:AGZA family xanthine/uracil permease-like MFS transporter
MKASITKKQSLFDLKGHNTSIRVETFAGLTVFLTMVYVLFLQPFAMIGPNESFIDINGVVVTRTAIFILTALISGAATIIMGVYSNFPFALSTAMGINFLLGGMLQSNQISFAAMMTVTLISGIVFVALTVLGVRKYIVDLIPKDIKIAIGTAIGFFLAYLGFSNSGIATFNNGIHMGNFQAPSVILSIIGLLLIVALEHKKVKGGILISVIVVTVLGIPFGVTNTSVAFSLPDFSSVGNLLFTFSFSELLKPMFITLLFATFFGDFFSTLGTVIGLGGRLNMLDEEGNLPGIDKPFLVDSCFTAIGAMFGCTVITTFVESAAGVESGGKTGLTSVVAGVLFLLAILLAPLVSIIPTVATAPILIYIGYLMICDVVKIDFSSLETAFGPFITIAFTIFFADFAAGIAGGIIAQVFIKLIAGKGKETKIGLYILSVLLMLYFVV